MGNLKITEVPQTSAVAATDDFYIKTGENFRRVPVSKLMELFITGGLSGWGIGYATCSTAEATAAKTAALTGYQLIKGGFVAVRFTNAVGAGATLSINSQTAKAIYYNGTAIVNNVIRAGDIAVLCYDGTYYQLVSIMPAGATILELEKSGSTVSLDMTFADAYTVFSNPWNTYLLLTVDTYVVLLMRPSKVDANNLQIYIEATVGTTLYTATLIPVVGQAVLSGTLVETQIGGGSADAVTYSAQTGKTDAEKAQARTNIGALGASDIGTVFTLKGSVATVADLPATGNSVGDVYYVDEKSVGYIWLTNTTYPNGYWEELGETIDLSAYQEKPVVVEVTGNTPTIALAENNKIYKCTGAAITAVTITAVDSGAEFCLKFDAPAAASPPNFSYPTSSIKMPDGFAVEANKHYEINVDADGYALVSNVWEITT